MTSITLGDEIAFYGQICHSGLMDSEKSPQYETRFVTSQEQIERIDRWRGRQFPIPSRREAMRRLIDRGLEAEERDAEAQR